MALSSPAYMVAHAQEEDILEITLGWNQDLHSGFYQLAFEIPEEFDKFTLSVLFYF